MKHRSLVVALLMASAAHAETPLQQDMSAVRSAIAARLAEAAPGPLRGADYVALATLVDEQVAHLVARHDITAEGGRPLQLVLGDMLDGAALMRGAARPEGRHVGLMKVMQGLERDVAMGKALRP